MSDDITSVQVKTDTWEVLNRMKRPGDSMDDVIQRLYSESEEENDDNRAVASS